ncbi:hypothetical protein GGS23DRAFT_147178 [Durotheca rogersii]|uniref:uncharacterized protein n=1 Tax=Durotheca rogersii TaxID=419775 RepID=UPI00221FEB14|nr:uncharacterized protein GGS23DRAFT_147178 [Durotheca rogersii]KAI5861339.1 hypothetical protein GGS23DRAFT_147178 [Durotheca rogersii]
MGTAGGEKRLGRERQQQTRETRKPRKNNSTLLYEETSAFFGGIAFSFFFFPDSSSRTHTPIPVSEVCCFFVFSSSSIWRRCVALLGKGGWCREIRRARHSDIYASFFFFPFSSAVFLLFRLCSHRFPSSFSRLGGRLRGAHIAHTHTHAHIQTARHLLNLPLPNLPLDIDGSMGTFNNQASTAGKQQKKKTSKHRLRPPNFGSPFTPNNNCFPPHLAVFRRGPSTGCGRHEKRRECARGGVQYVCVVCVACGVCGG